MIRASPKLLRLMAVPRRVLMLASSRMAFRCRPLLRRHGRSLTGLIVCIIVASLLVSIATKLGLLPSSIFGKSAADVVTDDLLYTGGDSNNARVQTVRAMMQFAWWRYFDTCGKSGENELAPLNNSCSPKSNSLVGSGQLLTAVSSLDTLSLMGLKNELTEARWMIVGLFRPRAITGHEVSVAETCIHLLGGFLGAYTLTKDYLYVESAIEIANSLESAFAVSDELSRQRVKLYAKKPPKVQENELLLADAGTIYLELTYLSHVSGDYKYADWAKRHQERLVQLQDIRGLYPHVFGPHGEPLPHRWYSAGAKSGPFYEYLLKRCLFDGNSDNTCGEVYSRSLDSIMRSLSVSVGNGNHTCVGNVKRPCRNRRRTFVDCQMEHSACFLGGTFALAYLQNQHRTDWLQFAENITRTCYLSYLHSPTGLGPERFTYDEGTRKFVAMENADSFLLRPETVESIHYLHYVTGNPMYLDWGWEITQAISNKCRTDRGFSGLRHMTGKPQLDNRQHSHFLSETLKYLYLLFSSPGRLPLDQWLLTTDAHIFPTKVNPMRYAMYG